MPSSSSEITLEIIAKSHWLGGFCYLGFDRKSQMIRRPILRDIKPFDKMELHIGKSYKFKFYISDQDGYPVPHSNDDVIVTSGKKVDTDRNRLRLPCDNRDFPIDRRFVEEFTDCPSVTVVKTKYARVYFNDRGKKRIEIRVKGEMKEFPYASLETPSRSELRDDFIRKYVVISLSRPFAGNERNPFNPRRCYLLVVRVFTD